MLVGSLENDETKGEGWLLLTVPLADEEGKPPLPKVNRDETFCLVSIKDLGGYQCLQKLGTKPVWGTEEVFHRLAVASLDDDNLVLRIQPGITAYLDSPYYAMTVRCEEGDFLPAAVHTHHITLVDKPDASGDEPFLKNLQSGLFKTKKPAAPAAPSKPAHWYLQNALRTPWGIALAVVTLAFVTGALIAFFTGIPVDP
jgi:hypothetical protein